MNTKIVLFHNEGLFMSYMVKVVTGCWCHHAGFLIEDSDYLYDMYFMRRRRKWSEIKDTDKYSIHHTIYDSPIEIPEEYLISKILDNNVSYGWKDFVKFGVRPLYHLAGKVTRNSNGLICSGMVAYDLFAHGWDGPKSWTVEEPSPCDLKRQLESK